MCIYMFINRYDNWWFLDSKLHHHQYYDTSPGPWHSKFWKVSSFVSGRSCRTQARYLLPMTDPWAWCIYLHFFYVSSIVSHAIHGTNESPVYLPTNLPSIKINHSWICKYTAIVPWIAGMCTRESWHPWEHNQGLCFLKVVFTFETHFSTLKGSLDILRKYVIFVQILTHIVITEEYEESIKGNGFNIVQRLGICSSSGNQNLEW